MRDNRDVTPRRISALLLTSLVAACSGEFESYAPDGGVEQADAGPDEAARQKFALEVQPLWEQRCSACHDTGTLQSPIFGAPPDRYSSLITYTPPLLSCKGPGDSLVITKGQHAGPAWDTATELPTLQGWINTWITVTPDCQGMTQAKPVTGPHSLLLGDNTISLAELGPGLEGAALTFTMDAVGGGLYLSQLTLRAGPGGLRVRSPRFETCGDMPPAKEDPTNEFANVDLTVPPDGAATLGDGTLVFTQTPNTVKLGIRFEELTPQGGPQGDAVDLGGACGPM